MGIFRLLFLHETHMTNQTTNVKQNKWIVDVEFRREKREEKKIFWFS